MSRLARFGALMAAGALLLGFMAAPATAAAPPAIGPLDVQVWAGAEPNQVLVIVGVTLPESVKLPATVRLPLVDGAEVTWAGEISNTGDTERSPVIKDGTGGKYAEFEISNSRAAQVELGGLPLTNSNSSYSANVRFVQTVPATLTAFAVRLPQGASNAKITPSPVGLPAKNEAGEALYTLPSATLKTGAGQDVSLKYEIGAPAVAPAKQNPFNTVLAVLLGLMAAAFVALLIVVTRRRRTAEEPAEMSDDQEAETVIGSDDDSWLSDDDDAFPRDE